MEPETGIITASEDSPAPAGGGRVVSTAQPPPAAPPPGISSPSFVYALGRVSPRFPSLGVEKEFAQATGRTDRGPDLSDRETLGTVLTANRYIARQMCWVLTIEGLETYILAPRDPADLDLLLAATRPAPRATDVDVVIGLRGPVAPPEACNGLMVPVVLFDQLYSFDIDALVGAIPAPDDTPRERFAPTAEELFSRIVQMADNAGASDEHRALNYLAVRYGAIYTQAAQMFARDFSLMSIEVQPSALSGTRSIFEVIFTFNNRTTDFTERYFTRVDVTEEFPFLFTKLSPYSGR